MYKSGRFCKCRRCGWWVPLSKVSFPVRRECRGDAETKQGLRGLGDLVEVATTVTGLALLSKIYHKIRNSRCGCEAKKASFNKLVSFTRKPKQ